MLVIGLSVLAVMSMAEDMIKRLRQSGSRLREGSTSSFPTL
jgi:hypothetical protein